MILIYGGAYNGKLQYVKENYDIKEEDIYYCEDSNIDFSKKVIYGLHKFTYENSNNEKVSIDYLKENINKLQDKIIICDEINSGIVPINKNERIWREDTGRALQYLSKNANKVVRVFFGIPTVLKDE